jgi:hypothetical protein
MKISFRANFKKANTQQYSYETVVHSCKCIAVLIEGIMLLYSSPSYKFLTYHVCTLASSYTKISSYIYIWIFNSYSSWFKLIQVCTNLHVHYMLCCLNFTLNYVNTKLALCILLCLITLFYDCMN